MRDRNSFRQIDRDFRGHVGQFPDCFFGLGLKVIQ
jgi:hypothetical protein